MKLAPLSFCALLSLIFILSALRLSPACDLCADKGFVLTNSLGKNNNQNPPEMPDGDFAPVRGRERGWTSEQKDFCNCAAGKALAHEAYEIIARTVPATAAARTEAATRIGVLKTRYDSAQKNVTGAEAEVRSWSGAKGDVYDQLTKAQHKFEIAREVAQKYEQAMLKGQTDSIEAVNNAEAARQLTDFVKRRLQEQGETVPNDLSWKPDVVKIRTRDELILAAAVARSGSANSNSPGASGETTKPTQPAGRPLRVYVLNDGREIKTKVVIENGDEVMLKGEDGKMLTVKKSEIKGVTEER